MRAREDPSSGTAGVEDSRSARERGGGEEPLREASERARRDRARRAGARDGLARGGTREESPGLSAAICARRDRRSRATRVPIAAVKRNVESVNVQSGRGPEMRTCVAQSMASSWSSCESRRAGSARKSDVSRGSCPRRRVSPDEARDGRAELRGERGEEPARASFSPTAKAVGEPRTRRDATEAHLGHVRVLDHGLALRHRD